VVEPPPGSTAYTTGVVAMAKTEADPAGASGSQFFIVTAPDARLPPDYAVAGGVVRGMDVAQYIGKLPVDGQDRPTAPVVIEKATLRTG
jgi:cyclophilin family peptidyl-prolyl cis-trans isomerase